MAVSEMDKSTVTIFSPILTHLLRPTELLSSAKLKQVLVDGDAVKNIRFSKEKDEEKVRQVLSLIGQSESTVKWQIFNEVLTDLGYIFMPKALLKEHNPTVQCHLEKIVESLQSEEIDTKALSAILQSHGLITDLDVQDIGTELFNQKEEKAALIVLIDRVVTPPPDEWYNEFLTCLMEAGYSEVVQRLQADIQGATANTKLENYSMDDHWRKLIMELFYQTITSCVRASEIVVNLSSVFDVEEKRAIRQAERNKTHEDAMKLLLDMFDKKDTPGKWSEFRSALAEADYLWIINAIEGDINYEEQQTWKMMLSIFEQKFADKIKPSEIIHEFCIKDPNDKTNEKVLISEQECQEILSEERYRGEKSAAFLLLTYLPKRHPQWYPLFLEILFLNKSDELVREIDYDEWKELNRKHPNSVQEKYYACVNTEMENGKKTVGNKMDQSDVKENLMSYTGEAILSNNNLSSPNNFGQDEGGLLLTSIMQELSTMDENIDTEDDEITKEKKFANAAKLPTRNNNIDTEEDEITKEKEFARVTKLLPPPARRGMVNQSHISLPNDQASGMDSLDNAELNSFMLDAVKRDLDLEITGEPERNIQVNPFENMKTENNSDSDEDDTTTEKEKLTLRSYQNELAAPGLQGKNCIIVAPTGSGKTHVALKIMEEHMAKIKPRRHPKVIFLVEQGALARQQAEMCKKYLPYNIKLITGEVQRNERQKSFSEWLKKRDILVVTAQLLVNALKERDVQICDFTLMVFDECHHSHAKHSYNQIMQQYLDIKLKSQSNKDSLPMIVGLTASVGVGRAKTTDGAIQWIKTMMANMDAEELATVRACVGELSEHVIVPEQIIKQTLPRKKNYFGEAVGKIMEVTEKYMKQSTYADCIPDKDKVLKAPPNKGTDQYTQWISKLWRECAKIFNQEARRFFTTCRSYLDLYNRGLIIYEDARVKDALEFLEENISRINENIIPDDSDKKMMSLFTKSKKLLEHCVNDDNHRNPKLDALKEMIAKTYKENLDSRGIIFVKTRDLVQAIQNWMRETEGLKLLNPIKFVGAQASGEKGGITKNDQDNILQLFRDGKHKLIIATSVAEEGLDIQKCNLVIRYDHVTNEIAMVQARGRGRAEGSQYYVVASAEKKTAEKEELNMMREARMNEAIDHLQSYIKKHRTQFLEEILNLQMEANIQRELENATKGGRIVGDYEFEMRCGKCNEFICMSMDIKKIQNAHHAVINDEIRQNITTIRCPKPTFEDENLKMGVGKVNCKKCGKNLGNIVIFKKAQFPVLKIENFLISDSRGNTDVYKKWKNAPFIPKELTQEDLLDRARGQQYVFDH